jgi:hypothetical protein
MTRTARRSIPLIVAAFCLVTSACVVTSVSPREAFLRAHPSERSKFVGLWEVSPEALRDAAKERVSLSTTLVTSLQRDFGHYPDLKDRLERFKASLEKTLRAETELVEKMLKQAAFDTKRDTLFSYERQDGLRYEFGWLVIRGNQIRVKQELGSYETLLPK